MDEINLTLDLEKLSLDDVIALKHIAVKNMLYDDAARLRYYENILNQKIRTIKIENNE